MIETVVTDTGTIVAFLDQRERWHNWAQEQWKKLPAPFLTCEAVITEACFLARHLSEGEQDVLSLVESEILLIDFSLLDEVDAVKALMKKYENVPMSLADACLVRMSETIENSVVFTLDSDFWIYRKNGKESIPLVAPPQK